MQQERNVIIGVDAGTSVLKAVAFDLGGQQLAVSAVRNTYSTGTDGSATQSMPGTWADCIAALMALSDKLPGLGKRVAALAVTGQGDGTWLVDRENAPVDDAWIWLDARAAPTVRKLSVGTDDPVRFDATGTGLNACQQGAQMAHMDLHHSALLDRADVALHCKDWLYLKLTGIRATDPSEASFTFGDFRSRTYSDAAIEALGLQTRRHLLPPIIDGTLTTHPLTEAAAEKTGLPAGTPVSLGYVDMVMTALGAGVHTGHPGAACSTLGSTGVHMRAVTSGNVHLNAVRTGYVICLPVPDLVTQVQTNMACTLNLDWILKLGADLIGETGEAPAHADMVARLDEWMQRTEPGGVIYHPYISSAGERGPFLATDARAGFVGLHSNHGFPDLVRAVVEGLGMAARDCYDAMGSLPTELRLTGGAARSAALRGVLTSALDRPVRVSEREEAGAAGCAMMAAVAIGAYDTMEACIADWTTPLLGPAEVPNPALVHIYDKMFTAYRDARIALGPTWTELAGGARG